MATSKGSSSNGGIMNSGIFGFFGTTIQCQANDGSIYCSIMKMFNLLMVFCVVAYILFFIYSYLTSKRKR
jgi:hypothetical protein